MQNPVRILLVEDEPLWQQAIQDLLATDERFEIIATADNAKDALQAFQQAQPQAILLDWQICGEQDGLEFGHQVLTLGLPPERVILISGANPGTIPKHPFLYVPKKQIPEELLPLLVAVTIN